MQKPIKTYRGWLNEPTKLSATSYEHVTYDECANIIHEKILQDQETSIDAVVEEALKRKGFSFDNKLELLEFVKLNCFAEKQTDHPEITVYYVKNLPFLKMIRPQFDLSYDFTDHGVFISSDLFKYEFL